MRTARGCRAWTNSEALHSRTSRHPCERVPSISCWFRPGIQPSIATTNPHFRAGQNTHFSASPAAAFSTRSAWPRFGMAAGPRQRRNEACSSMHSTFSDPYTPGPSPVARTNPTRCNKVTFRQRRYSDLHTGSTAGPWTCRRRLPVSTVYDPIVRSGRSRS